MKFSKLFFPIFLLIAGGMGLAFFPHAITYDGGFAHSMYIPEAQNHDANGNPLYTLKEIEDFTDGFIKSRAGYWYFDLLSAYLFVHGILSVIFRRHEFREWMNSDRRFRSLAIDLTLGIMSGVVFWLVIIRLLSAMSVTLH